MDSRYVKSLIEIGERRKRRMKGEKRERRDEWETLIQNIDLWCSITVVISDTKFVIYNTSLSCSNIIYKWCIPYMF
jgi:hypothetical protein